MRHFYNLRALSISARPIPCKVLFSLLYSIYKVQGVFPLRHFLPCVGCFVITLLLYTMIFNLSSPKMQFFGFFSVDPATLTYCTKTQPFFVQYAGVPSGRELATTNTNLPALHIYRQILFLKFIYFYFSNFPQFYFSLFLNFPSNLPSTLQANNKLSFSAPYQIKFDKNKKLYYNKENKKFVW